MNLEKLGHKPIFDINSTLEYNNGKLIFTNLHSKGKEEFFKGYSKDLISVTSIKPTKNKLINKAINTIVKKVVKKQIDKK